MSTAVYEIIWLIELLREMGIKIPIPIPLNADNTGAIKLAQNRVFHERTKHIEVGCHFI